MSGTKKFVILAQPRTGSTFVADLFASRPEAFCYLETAMPVSIAKLHHPWRNAPGQKTPAAAPQPAAQVR